MTTLTGTYQLPDGTPAAGHVEIIPSEKKILDADGKVILSGRAHVPLVVREWPKLDANGEPVLDAGGEPVMERGGSFSVDLPATDDPTLNPTGFGYTLVAKMNHTHLRPVSFSLPAEPATVDIVDLDTVDPASFTPDVTYATGTDLADVADRVAELEAAPAPVTSWSELEDKPETFKPDVTDPDLAATIATGSGRYVPTAATADGTTDDTAAIQAVIDALPVGGLIDGGGKTYAVTSLQLKSDMVMENFNLLTLPGTTGFRSPVTIGITANAAPSANVDTTLWQNITLRRVHVNGQRAQQTGNLYISEDGGLHGFRILGRVENLLMEDCSATMCATDGIEIYSGFGVEAFKSYSDGIKRNLRFVRCDFTWNRRHGASLDAATDVWFEDCRFNDNGQDVAGGTTGASGARSPNALGALYGNGMDAEEYGLKTYTGDIHYVRCEAKRNVKAGMLHYIPESVNADDPNFVTRDGFYFESCRFDRGTAGGSEPSLIVTCHATDEALGPYFKNVHIRDCDLEGAPIGGGFTVRSATGVRHTGGTVTASSTYVGGLVNAHAVSAGVDRNSRTYSLNVGATVTYADADRMAAAASAIAVSELWVPAKSFAAVTSATETTVNGVHGISLADAATSRITTVLNLPTGWATMDAYLVWTMATASAGNARLLYYGTELPGGATIPASQTSPDVVVGATAGSAVVVSSKFPAAKTVTANRTILLGIRRDGGHVDDTLADAMVVLGVKLVKKT